MNFFNHPNIEHMAAENDYDGLLNCLEHRDKLVRLQAAQALADMNDGAGWRFLMDAVRKYDDPDTQATAAAMLGELGHPRAIAVLAEALKKTRGETAEAIRDALEAIPGPEAEEALRQAGYEPVISNPGPTGVTEYEAHFVRPVITQTGQIRYQTAEEHLNNAVQLRESEMTERGMVETSLALWLMPNWAYAWYLRGVLFEDRERIYEAALAYRHAVELDSTQADAREALNDMENEVPILDQDFDQLMAELTDRDWSTRRDAAAGLGDMALRGSPNSRQAVDLLINLLQDEEREVRHAAVEALGYIDDRRAILPLLEMQESSWLVRFAILQTLSRLGSVDGLVTVLQREMGQIQQRNPVFSSHKDPLLEVEYDLQMEIGVRALELTGDVEALLLLNEANIWEDVDDESDAAENGGTEAEADESGDYTLGGYNEDEEETEPDEDLTSYVDETAEMAAAALDRLAAVKLGQLPVEILNRLASVPDLTLIDLTSDEEENNQPSEPVVVYDLSTLRAAAKSELAKRG